ncbi:hypothetical protein [Leptospira sp. 'Mane']|uniref:hypothetical protein n=1 Tax=Leptospira sp. 'Mane' TaxID=3387407 RepID=UPI00398A7261
MFGLFVSALIFIYQLSVSHQTSVQSLVFPARFLFWWNLIFPFLGISIFTFLFLGLFTILFRVPFIGQALEAIRAKMKERGVFGFLGKHFFFWIISLGSILAGSYMIGYMENTNQWITILSLGLILEGHFTRKIFRKGLKIKSELNYNLHVDNSSEHRIEKDVSEKSIN